MTVSVTETEVLVSLKYGRNVTGVTVVIVCMEPVYGGDGVMVCYERGIER